MKQLFIATVSSYLLGIVSLVSGALILFGAGWACIAAGVAFIGTAALLRRGVARDG